MAFSTHSFRNDYNAVRKEKLSVEDFENKYKHIFGDKFKYEYVKDGDPINMVAHMAQLLNGATQSITLNKLMSKEIGTDSPDFENLFKIDNFGKFSEEEFEDDDGKTRKVKSFLPDEAAFKKLATSLFKTINASYESKFEELEERLNQEIENKFNLDDLRTELKGDVEKIMLEKSPILMKQSSATEQFARWADLYANQSFYQNKDFREMVLSESGKDQKFYETLLSISKDIFSRRLSKNPNLSLTGDVVSSVLRATLTELEENGISIPRNAFDLPLLDQKFTTNDYDNQTFELKSAQQPAIQTAPEQIQKLQQQFTQPFAQPQARPVFGQPQQIQQPVQQSQLTQQQELEAYIAPTYTDVEVESPMQALILKQLQNR